MRALLATLLAILATLAIALPARGEQAWEDPPADAVASLFATGADAGWLRPRGCHAGAGGALYRPALRAWLAERQPTLQQFWISTGNVGRVGEPEPAQPLEAMYEFMTRAGYAAVAVGPLDLEEYGAEHIVALAARTPFPLVASNLVVHETGLPAVRDHVVLETRAGRVGLIAVLPHRAERTWGTAETGTIVTLEPLPVVQDLVHRLRPEVDTLVLLSTIDSVSLATLLRAAPGIDLVLAQEGPRMPSAPETVEGVRVVLLGTDGVRLARTDLGARGALGTTALSLVDETFPIDPLTAERRPAAASAGPGAGPGVH